MTDRLNFDDEIHELHLGKSFDANGGLAFHSIRYDFKPHSLDPTQTATVEVGQGNMVSVKVPHIPGSSSTHTEYRGNKRPCQKECIIIIDHVTGEFTLEKLSSNIQLKSTRSKAASSKQVNNKSAAATLAEGKPAVSSNPPAEKKQKLNSGAAAKSNHINASNNNIKMPEVNNAKPGRSLSDESSDSDNSSSSSSSDEDSDNESSSNKDNEGDTKDAGSSVVSRTALNCLSEDLRLSDSDSD